MQQHYSDFGPSYIAHSPIAAQHFAHHGLDSLAEGSHYAIQQLQQQQQHAIQTLNGSRPQLSHRQSFGSQSVDSMAAGHRESTGATKVARSGSTSGQPVRRRISRACDQCNQLRTKCDGKHPCAHCVEFGLTCEYARERKKRGKASRRYHTKVMEARWPAVSSLRISNRETYHSMLEMYMPLEFKEELLREGVLDII